jgi:hypothetical protein
MLDGIQNQELKTFMAVHGKGEHGDKAVTFQAIDKAEARKMLEDQGLDDYRIVWESSPRDSAKS